MTCLNKELVAYRMSRADETLEGARILANSEAGEDTQELGQDLQ